MSSTQQHTTGGDAPQEQSSFGPHVGSSGQHSGGIHPSEEIGHFSGKPIGEGPKQLPDDINDTRLWFPTLALRSSLSEKPQAAWRREAIIMIARETLNRSYIYPFREIPKHSRRIAIEVLETLDEMIQGIPYKIPESNETGYFIDPIIYRHLLDLLQSHLEAAMPLLIAQKEVIPPLPVWGLKDNPKELWSASDFEFVAALFRDDAENLIGFLYDQGALKAIGKFKSTRRSFFQREEVQSSTPMRRSEITHLSIHPTPMSSYRSHPSGLQQQHGISLSHDIQPRRSTDTFTHVRRRQSAQTFGTENTPVPPVYGIHPRQLSASNRMQEMFDSPVGNEGTQKEEYFTTQEPSRGSPPSSDGESSRATSRSGRRASKRPRRSVGFSGPPGGEPPSGGSEFGSDSSDSDKDGKEYGIPSLFKKLRTKPSSAEAHFDIKLKTEAIPRWDGHPDSLAKWVLKLNHLAERSKQIFKQLGQLVPTRLEKEADQWFWSLPVDYRRVAMTDWGTLRDVICSYFMNRAWLDRQKSRANKAHYREPGYSSESPTSYYIRKSELLLLVYRMNDSEIMMEMMNGAPAFWRTIIDPHRCRNLVEFASAIKYYEESLENTPFQGSSSSSSLDRRIRQLEESFKNSNRSSSSARFNNYSGGNNTRPTYPHSARSNLIGASSSLPPPSFPRDDSVISKGNTPEKKGARPCRFCGSPKHWDNDCRHSRSGSKQVRVRFAHPDEEYLRAQSEYEEAYLEYSSDEGRLPVIEEENEPPEDSGSSETLRESLFVAADVKTEGIASTYLVNAAGIGEVTSKRPSQLSKVKSYFGEIKERLKTPILSLQRLMARPPGCAFLGSQATSTTGWIAVYNSNPTKIVIDSGADITLISHLTLMKLHPRPKIKIGQRINLVQVTGASTISGFIIVPIYFDTPDGPVELLVEAYVVKGMTTPFILGNDFADQYALSILRSDEGTHLVFGDSGRRISVENSIGMSLTDEKGHAFQVKVNRKDNMEKARIHRKSQRIKKQIKNASESTAVKSIVDIIIPPESVKKIPVQLNFPENSDTAYIEKIFISNRGEEDIYASPDSLIAKDDCYLRISNFSSFPVRVHEGQVLGYVHNPDQWLDSPKDLSAEELQSASAHAFMVQSIADILSKKPAVSSLESEGIGELDGGPKIAESPPMDISKDNLLKVVDISKDLSSEQSASLSNILMRNHEAFGLDGRLGHYPARVEIPLREGAKEISLPPFFGSPASRQIIDEQMDKWIALKVIEPSKSPWGAPGFITYRNGKPRMVIDFRGLNSQVIPDEFPLPKQEDILQSLTGSQWLSTLDALAGFTQLEIATKDKEKTAFRTHRGLFQFLRMPFGFRNGPAVFQRVMQNILSPYLWIFALVYIDDIVIYSKTFGEHLDHLNQVLGAISKSGITLSPEKCHFAYQSLMLLGQQVSRLGLSTHQEKIEAIIQLDEPRNIKELQVFLGMAVYFSGYIPFYAWIVKPLFQLLKKGVSWKWGPSQQNAFELAKLGLTSAPIRAYGIRGRGYRLYTDACDIGIAGILQQVQPILIRDLLGTKVYERLQRAFDKNEPIPQLVIPVTKNGEEGLPSSCEWAEDFEATTVYIERVITYWSQTLKPAEQNYSPTEQEALALKDSLIKFQPYIEGEEIWAVTDHAALTWSRTFQNVNRRLLLWGTIFAAYPNLHIVHRAGRVHSNVDPISRLRRRIPREFGPLKDQTSTLTLESLDEDAIGSFYQEIAPQFESKVLNLCVQLVSEDNDFTGQAFFTKIPVENPYLGITEMSYSTAQSYSILIGIDPSKITRFVNGYSEDPHFKTVLNTLRDEDNWENPRYPQYSLGDNGLLFFEDSQGIFRLCVPQSLRVEIMGEIHNVLTEGAHMGYHKTYNRISSGYYWPRMSREILKYVLTCDVCQKSKVKRHAPYGLLQPIPIPSQPFEVISMDFIPELPDSHGFDNILVIVDKLTKYLNLIPCQTEIKEAEVAELVFKHIFANYGLPRQIISDRDPKWTGLFWESVCKQMGIKRGLTTAYHPQSDGQTEIMNQTLEVALRAYIGPERDDWADHLDGFKLAYNTNIHMGTGFTPAFLLYGFEPASKSAFIKGPSETVNRPDMGLSAGRTSPSADGDFTGWSRDADEMVESFRASRSQAQDALLLGQIFQKRSYNNGRLVKEFQPGDKVMLNPHSLKLLRNIKGRGRKLLMQYDGPFEIMEKISAVAYRLRMPESYGTHPVLNIEHLESYHVSPPEFGERPMKSLGRDDFEALPEYEVDGIIDEKWGRSRNGKRQKLYRVRFTGYSPNFDQWLPRKNLKNAPEVLRTWDNRFSLQKENPRQ